MHDRYARVLEIVDPSVAMSDVDRPPLVLPRRLTLDGGALSSRAYVVEVDGIRPSDEWPLIVTLAVPSEDVKYVITETDATGMGIRGRVWIDTDRGPIEVYAPYDPISYPASADIAHVNIHVDEFRVGADRDLELV